MQLVFLGGLPQTNVLASSESLPGIINVIEITEFGQLNIVNKRKEKNLKGKTPDISPECHDAWVPS